MKRLFRELIYNIYYVEENKTVYIQPPVKVIHLNLIKKRLSHLNLEIDNIVVGRPYEVY